MRMTAPIINNQSTLNVRTTKTNAKIELKTTCLFIKEEFKASFYMLTNP